MTTFCIVLDGVIMLIITIAAYLTENNMVPNRNPTIEESRKGSMIAFLVMALNFAALWSAR